MAVNVENPHLTKLPVDYLYHLNIDNETTNLKEKFGDVKFVVMGGAVARMSSFAQTLYDTLKDIIPIQENAAKNDLAEKGGRYCMFKVGPVLITNHGMGFGSLSILLNEVIKMLHYAEAKNVSFLRLGTCGGLGQTPGTICITKSGYTEILQDFYPVPVMGKIIETSTKSSDEFNKEIMDVADRFNYKYKLGNTVSTNCFYEAQGRIDGAFCNYDEADKFAWFDEISEKHGIINFEMESTCFLSMCNRAKVRGSCACVALVNRKNTDQVTNTKEEMSSFVNNLIEVVVQLIVNHVTATKK